MKNAFRFGAKTNIYQSMNQPVFWIWSICIYIIETIRVQIVFYPLLENFQNEKSEKPWKKFVSVTIPLFNKSTMFNKSMFLELFMQTISNEMLNMPWCVCFPTNSIKKQAQKLISIWFPVLHGKYVFG